MLSIREIEIAVLITDMLGNVSAFIDFFDKCELIKEGVQVVSEVLDRGDLDFVGVCEAYASTIKEELYAPAKADNKAPLVGEVVA